MNNCSADQQEHNETQTLLGKEAAVLWLGIINGIMIPSYLEYCPKKFNFYSFMELFISICQFGVPSLILTIGWDLKYSTFSYRKLFLKSFIPSLLITKLIYKFQNYILDY